MVEILISVAIVSAVLQKLKEGRFVFKKPPFMTALLFFVGINALSLIWSTHLDLSMRAMFTKTLKYIALFYVVYEFVDSEKKLKRLLAVILFSVLLITLNGLEQQFITGYDLLHMYRAFSLTPIFRGFVTSSFPFPNDYATWIIMLLPLAMTLCLFDLKKEALYKKLLSYFALVLLVYSLYLTKARGAWCAFFGGLTLLSFLRSKVIIVAFLLLAVIFYAISSQEVKNAIKSTISFKDRFVMWNDSIAMLKDRPLRGFGLNTYFENYKLYRNDRYKYQKGSYAHNCYLQQAVDLGIPGLIIFVYFLGSVLVSSFRSIIKIKDNFYSNCCFGMWVGVLNFTLYAFVDTAFYSLPLAVLFYFMVGLTFASIDIYEKRV